jgi:hypothetical protein
MKEEIKKNQTIGDYLYRLTMATGFVFGAVALIAALVSIHNKPPLSEIHPIMKTLMNLGIATISIFLASKSVRYIINSKEDLL